MINAFKQIRLTNLGVSGANGRLNVNASGLAYYSELTGVSGNLSTRLDQTGSSLKGLIDNISGGLTTNYATISYVTGVSGTLSSRIDQTGSTLKSLIDNVSGGLTANYATISYVTGVSGNLSTRLDQTGSALKSLIDNISGGLTANYATTSYVTGVSGGLQSQINNLNTSLSGSYVTLGTTQTISGDKTFNSNVYIKNLYVTGTQTVVNTETVNVASNYLNLNATGGARDGGIFINFSSNSGSGAYIGWDIPSNTWRFGSGVSGTDLSTLDYIASQAYVTSSITAATGNVVFTTNINQNISGSKTFISALNLATQASATGHAVAAARIISGGSGLAGGGNLTSDVTLNVGQGYGISVSADSVAVNTSDVVVTTGTQTVGGSKTFSSSVTIPQATTTGHAVAAARIISGGSGLAGGGNLTSDVTLNIGQGYGISVSTDSVAVNTSEVVVITGSQIITGPKTFNELTSNTLFSEAGSISLTDSIANLTVLNLSEGNTFFLQGPTGNSSKISFYSQGVDDPYITGFSKIWATNIYQGTNRVIDSSQTGSFITNGQTGSFITTSQTGSFVTTGLTGNFVTTQFASATYATLVSLNQKINWVSGQSQAFTVSVTTGVDTQSVSFPYAFTGGTIPTVQVTLDIPSTSDYMYNAAVRSITTSGFTALYSDVVLETGVVLNIWASKLYGSI